MLVLTRKEGESIKVGDCITVTVLAVAGNRVKLGFSAPVGVAIRRNELLPKLAPTPTPSTSLLPAAG